MRLGLGSRAKRRLRTAAIGAAVLAVATVSGRALLGAANGNPATAASYGRPAPPSSQALGEVAGASNLRASKGSFASSGSAVGSSAGPTGAPAPGSIAHTGVGTATTGESGSQGSPANSSPTSVVSPLGPDVVRTATVDLSVVKGVIASEMTKVADLAGSEGGYVNSSSMSGGTARTAPVSGTQVIRVPETTFDQTLSQLATFGKLTAQQVSGQDVTGQLAQNAATIAVLQQEVNLLQTKLSETTDITTFLQIEGQLAPVQQQLQQLESQQAVLQSSVSLATVTVNLAAPGAPVGPTPVTHPRVSPAKAAWRYATHNTLVVLDGIAVAGGWAFPLLVVGGIGWAVVTRVLRRRRPGVTPA